MARNKKATAIPRANAKATKYQSVGNPRTKMRTLPAAKRRPMKPPPKESLCIVIPGWRSSVIVHLVYCDHRLTVGGGIQEPGNLGPKTLQLPRPRSYAKKTRVTAQ